MIPNDEALALARKTLRDFIESGACRDADEVSRMLLLLLVRSAKALCHLEGRELGVALLHQIAQDLDERLGATRH